MHLLTLPQTITLFFCILLVWFVLAFNTLINLAESGHRETWYTKGWLGYVVMAPILAILWVKEKFD